MQTHCQIYATGSTHAASAKIPALRLKVGGTSDWKVARTRRQECPTGMSALRVAQAFQPAGAGDIPVRHSCQTFLSDIPVPSFRTQAAPTFNHTRQSRHDANPVNSRFCDCVPTQRVIHATFPAFGATPSLHSVLRAGGASRRGSSVSSSFLLWLSLGRTALRPKRERPSISTIHQWSRNRDTARCRSDRQRR
jgi:hypothetical protein